MYLKFLKVLKVSKIFEDSQKHREYSYSLFKFGYFKIKELFLYNN